MDKARTALMELLAQLDAADSYAKQQNGSKVPSIWQLQNSHLRDYANQAPAALDATAP